MTGFCKEIFRLRDPSVPAVHHIAISPETCQALLHAPMKKRTRILLHLEDAVKQGYNKVSIRTVDTDVVVLAVASAQRLNITELWIAFDAGKNFRYLPAHEMADTLGPDRCVALPMFHAFTGCDTVSCFGGRGKCTAWDMWNAYDEIKPAFCALAATPETVEN